MATRSFVAKLYADGTANAEVAADKVGAIDYTAFAAALATLVADGASPTQAHVTAANSAWTTLKAVIDTATGHVATGRLVGYFDATTISSRDKLKTALNAVLQTAISTAQVT